MYLQNTRGSIWHFYEESFCFCKTSQRHLVYVFGPFLNRDEQTGAHRLVFCGKIKICL